MKHTLNQTLQIVRHLESTIASIGNCHFAIGGSTVMVGESDKDFDIFAYPRHGTRTNIDCILKELENQGWTIQMKNLLENKFTAAHYPDKQFAIITTPKGYRVDLFFMSVIPAYDTD